MPTVEVEEPVQKAKPWVRIACVVGAVVVVSGIAGFIWQMKVAEDKTAYSQTIARQNMAGLTKDYSGAIKDWEKYMTRSQPRNYDYEATVRIGLLYETLKQPQRALERYRLAEKMNHEQGAAVPEGIARTSEKLGDLATAVKYYRKCGEIYLKQPGSRTESDWMFSKADRLEKSVVNASK